MDEQFLTGKTGSYNMWEMLLEEKKLHGILKSAVFIILGLRLNLSISSINFDLRLKQ